MSRHLSRYIAGAAFALCASAGFAANAQTTANQTTANAAQSQAEADSARADTDAARAEDHREHAEHRMEHADHQMERHEERRIMIMRDGEGHHHMDPAEHLRTMLQLKPGQEAALTAYLAAVKMPEHMHDHVVEMSIHGGPEGAHDGAHDGGPPKTTTERLAEMEKRMADSQAQARVRIDATRKFYGQLDPAQKKVFDEMPMLMIGPIGPIGPMMMPGPMKVRFEHPPMPPMPPMAPMPPAPPVPPRS